jgi:D-arabinose 1-dehydrogenase-like Zn-dependent alcohol dehydrogenase
MPNPTLSTGRLAAEPSPLHQVYHADSRGLRNCSGLLRGQNLNNRVNVAVIGAGGKGASDTDHAAKAGGNIIALCDVDQNTVGARGAKDASAKLFKDYRKMLDQMEDEIDAVVVSARPHPRRRALWR